MGISFYIFQSAGYVIDVYRGDTDAEKNFFNYALFIAFFPKLVSGPIERSKDFLKQIREISNTAFFNLKRLSEGCILMIWGYFLKMVIADRAAILVNTVFDNYYMYGSVELCAAAVGFALQIYCDFASYSTIAAGAAKILGFSLMENFNTPYFATGIKDFWRRWHISLSTWLRDYVYISLGGNRQGKARKAFNLFVTFAVSGIWHGANWTYIVWGAMHGFYQIISDYTLSFRNKIKRICKVKTDCFSYTLFQRLATFLMVDAAWIVFRSDSISDAVQYFRRIFTMPTPWMLFNGGLFTLGLNRVEMNILLISVLLLFLVDLVRMKQQLTIDAFLLRQNLWFTWIAMIGLICFIFIYGTYGPAFDSQSFIYFQF
ncbi:MAG: MBOAT family protein [Roseburia sp.]|nr:MBOAT family protein [Roseburia sp.]